MYSTRRASKKERGSWLELQCAGGSLQLTHGRSCLLRCSCDAACVMNDPGMISLQFYSYSYSYHYIVVHAFHSAKVNW